MKYLSVVQPISTLFAGHGFLEHWGIVSFGGPVSGLALSRLFLSARCKGSHTLNTKVLKDFQVVHGDSGRVQFAIDFDQGTIPYSSCERS